MKAKNKKPKIILMQGLPASGKTTEAKRLVEEEGYTRVNKDDIRKMFHNGEFSKENEEYVINLERGAVASLMAGKKNIVVDNTHLYHKSTFKNPHIEFYQELAKDYGYEVEIREMYVDVDEAIKRDSKRANPVGEEVIMRMAKKYKLPSKFPMHQKFQPWDRKLNACIIVDIDGTVAFMDGKRSPYDYTKVSGDRKNEHLETMLSVLHEAGAKIIFVSGRKDDCRKETQQWLIDNGFTFGMKSVPLLMRKTGDNRCDSIVKKELYEKNIKGKFNVLTVFDDRNRVVDMWRAEGLFTCQTYYGDF